MNVQAWTFVMVGLSFALYIGVALWSKARSTGDFLRRWQQCSPRRQRYGNRSGLDERSLFHLHGRTYLVYGTRRFRLSARMDRRLRVAGIAIGTLPPQIRQIHSPRFRR